MLDVLGVSASEASTLEMEALSAVSVVEAEVGHEAEAAAEVATECMLPVRKNAGRPVMSFGSTVQMRKEPAAGATGTGVCEPHRESPKSAILLVSIMDLMTCSELEVLSWRRV